MKVILLIAFLGVIGTLMRYVIGEWCQTFFHLFPLLTLLINISGSFAAGAVTKLLLSDEIKQILLIGLIGTFTTFATYAKDVVVLLEQRKIGYALGYCLTSNVFSVVAVYAGMHSAMYLMKK